MLVLTLKGINSNHNCLDYQNLALRNGSEAFERWRETSVPIFMKFHFFEHYSTNDTEDTKDGYKVRERGPYVYEERRVKHVMARHEDEDLVQYREEKSFVFRSDLSTGHESDLINMVNLPILVSHFSSNSYSIECGLGHQGCGP